MLHLFVYSSYSVLFIKVFFRWFSYLVIESEILFLSLESDLLIWKYSLIFWISVSSSKERLFSWEMLGKALKKLWTRGIEFKEFLNTLFIGLEILRNILKIPNCLSNLFPALNFYFKNFRLKHHCLPSIKNPKFSPLFSFFALIFHVKT